MSVQLKRGETVNLNALALRVARRSPVLTEVFTESLTEKVIGRNDLTALHLIMKVRGV